MPTVINSDFPETDINEHSDLEEILKVFKENNPSLNGFGGDCWAAAYAINEVLLSGEGLIVAALNKALYMQENMFIGHVAIHYHNDNGENYFLDLDGVKDIYRIESWAALDMDDIDYQEMFEDYSIPLTPENFNEVVWISYTKNELEEWIDKDLLEQYMTKLQEVKNATIKSFKIRTM